MSTKINCSLIDKYEQTKQTSSQGNKTLKFYNQSISGRCLSEKIVGSASFIEAVGPVSSP
jgi:hypothetical protein